jgi:hypothetical protein
MNRVFFLIYLTFIFTFHISAQSKPFIGYDNIPWSASAVTGLTRGVDRVIWSIL